MNWVANRLFASRQGCIASCVAGLLLLGLISRWLTQPSLPSAKEQAELAHELGFRSCEAQSLAPSYPLLSIAVDCELLFREVVASDGKTSGFPTRDQVEAEDMRHFTLNGRVQLFDWYFRQEYNGEIEPWQWTPEVVGAARALARSREPFGTYFESSFVHAALDAHPISGRGVIVGSENPWLEAIFLEHGAAEVLTMEYHPIISNVDQIKPVHPVVLAKDWRSYSGLEWGASYSSLEHSGLGRYGDPLNPWGDLREMQRLSCLVKPGGLFFLNVPSGMDAIHWNAHRIYGAWRKPLLTANWIVLGFFQDKMLSFEGDVLPIWKRYVYRHFVVVLRNARGSACN